MEVLQIARTLRGKSLQNQALIGIVAVLGLITATWFLVLIDVNEDSNWLIGPVFLIVWAIAGFLIGRWWALSLFVLVPILTLVTGTETSPAGDQPLWTYYAISSVFTCLPMIAIGVGIRKFANKRLIRKVAT
ncbi:MAG: hypothetical protein WBW62_12955 [Solirubrobacterales bacterium]